MVGFDLLPVAVPHLLWQALIASFVELADEVEAFLLHNASLCRKGVVLPQRAAASELIIELSEVDHRNGHQVEGVSAHDAGLDSHE